MSNDKTKQFILDYMSDKLHFEVDIQDILVAGKQQNINHWDIKAEMWNLFAENKLKLTPNWKIQNT